MSKAFAQLLTSLWEHHRQSLAVPMSTSRVQLHPFPTKTCWTHTTVLPLLDIAPWLGTIKFRLMTMMMTMKEATILVTTQMTVEIQMTVMTMVA